MSRRRKANRGDPRAGRSGFGPPCSIPGCPAPSTGDVRLNVVIGSTGRTVTETYPACDEHRTEVRNIVTRAVEDHRGT